MKILFITGTSTKETRTLYLKELFNRIRGAVYLNFDNLISSFANPNLPPTEFNYTDRIENPSYKAILALALANKKKKKIVIIDGKYDLQKMLQCMHWLYPELKKASEEIALNDSSVYPSEGLFETVDNILKSLPAERVGIPKSIPKPVLALSAGLAGTGKTTTFTELSKQMIDSIHLEKDIIGSHFLTSVGLDMQSSYYTTHIKNQVYEALFAFAVDNMRFRKSAIVDGWFGDKLQEPWLAKHLGANDYNTILFYFHCTAQVQLARIKARNERRDDAKLQDFLVNRKKDLETHLKHFAEVTFRNILFINTENEILYRGIIDALCNCDDKTLRKASRENSIDSRRFIMTDEESQEGLQTFGACLQRLTTKIGSSYFWNNPRYGDNPEDASLFSASTTSSKNY